MASGSQPFPWYTARKLVADLFSPNPWIFWTDFLLTIAVAYGAAGIYLSLPLGHVGQLVALPIAAVALFRLSLFMHEIVHFRRGEMTHFKVAWNLLAGIPMLTPSFLYESHLTHHNTHHYGTVHDGEYLPLGGGRIRDILWFLAQPFFLPIYVTVRFLIAFPVSLLHPKLRTWVLERMSSFVINFSYRREIPEKGPQRIWMLVELGCFLRILVAIAVVAVGIKPLSHIGLLYSLAVVTLMLNHVRTLVAHRYQSDGGRMDHVEQLHDSVNISGRTPLVALMFPVGLRYHALHHLFPSLPYHNLGKAHRRLMAGLPADSVYHRSTYPSFFAAVADLLRSCRRALEQTQMPAEVWYRRLRKLRARHRVAAMRARPVARRVREKAA